MLGVRKAAFALFGGRRENQSLSIASQPALVDVADPDRAQRHAEALRRDADRVLDALGVTADGFAASDGPSGD